uniref:SOCS box domain-containing protein n=1 Tax=Oncorhynchus kisutch TaxID=8019 RepID=A0A8C7D8A9_ONCKI
FSSLLLVNGCDIWAYFRCAYGCSPHPAQDSIVIDINSFCELISSTVCNWAGPIVDLLLDYVGDVQLCARLTDIKTKSLSAHPLMHLCRLRIHEQMVVSRLRSLDSLPLPETAAVPQPDQTQL